MRTQRFLLAAAIAIGGVSFVGSSVRAEDQTANDNQSTMQNAADRTSNAIERAGEKTGNAIRRAGDRVTGATTNPSQAMAPDAKDIQKTLRDVTDAALTKGGFDDLVERFSDADRNRLGKDKSVEQKDPTLDGRIAQMQKDWKAKYNQDFKISDYASVYDPSFATIVQGEFAGANARLAGERQNGTGGSVQIGNTSASGTISTNTGNTSGTMDRTNRDQTQTNTDINSNANNTPANTGDKTRDREEKNLATIVVAASHGLPEVTVPMVHEFPDRWKIDVPDNYTGQQLHDNLLKHLTMVDEQKDQWPSDPNEAYRLVSHHVLMAVMNVSDNGQLQDTHSTNGANNGTSTPGGTGSDNNK